MSKAHKSQYLRFRSIPEYLPVSIASRGVLGRSKMLHYDWLLKNKDWILFFKRLNSAWESTSLKCVNCTVLIHWGIATYSFICNILCQVEVTCGPGYVRRPNVDESVCTVEGTWDPPVPTCPSEYTVKKSHYPPSNHHAIHLLKCPISSPIVSRCMSMTWK